MASRRARLVALGLLPRAAAAPPQNAVQLLRGAFVWRNGLDIDADGGRHAYAPPGSGLDGLDWLANAGTPGHYYGLACNAAGTPYEQGPADPAPGFYVSVTAYVDHTKSVNDPLRYVDAETVPYLVVPPDLTGLRGVHMGDYAIGLYGDKLVAGVVGDVGPHGHYGEASIAWAAGLGVPSSPKHGGCSRGVTCLVFPGSGKAWPRDMAEVAAQAQAMFQAWGGAAGVPWLAPQPNA